HQALAAAVVHQARLVARAGRGARGAGAAARQPALAVPAEQLVGAVEVDDARLIVLGGGLGEVRVEVPGRARGAREHDGAPTVEAPGVVEVAAAVEAAPDEHGAEGAVVGGAGAAARVRHDAALRRIAGGAPGGAVPLPDLRQRASIGGAAGEHAHVPHRIV